MATIEKQTFQTYRTTDEGKALFDGLSYDETTISAIDDEFFNRYVQGDFYTYIRRRLTRLHDRYYANVRIESAKIDWMVSRYLEREHVNTNTATETGTGKTTTSGSDTGKQTHSGGDTTNTTRTPNLTTENTGNGTRGGTNTDTTETTDASGDVTARKNAPNNISYSGADAGTIPSLNWQYMSSQEQSEHNGTQTNETTHAINETNSDSNTQKQTGTETTATTTTLGGVLDTTATKSGETNDETSKTSETTANEHEIYTGRDGEPAEILARAKRYIRSSNAIEWLFSQIDGLFLQVFEDEDEE